MKNMYKLIVNLLKWLSIERIGSIFFFLIVFIGYWQPINYEREIFFMVGMCFFILVEIKNKIPKKIKFTGDIDLKAENVNFNVAKEISQIESETLIEQK